MQQRGKKQVFVPNVIPEELACGCWNIPGQNFPPGSGSRYLEGLYLRANGNSKESSKKLGRDVAIAFRNTDYESLCLAGAWESIVELLSCGRLVLKLQWGPLETPMLDSPWQSFCILPSSLVLLFGYSFIIHILTSAGCCFPALAAPLDPQSERSTRNDGGVGQDRWEIVGNTEGQSSPPMRDTEKACLKIWVSLKSVVI